LGSASWSAAEYAIHRLIGHGRKRTKPDSVLGRFGLAGLAYEFNREHLAHHTDPSYFAPTSRKVVAAAIAIPAATLVLTPLVGLRRAASFATGFSVAYGTYEVLHRRVHTHRERIIGIAIGQADHDRRALTEPHPRPVEDRPLTERQEDLVRQTGRPHPRLEHHDTLHLGFIGRLGIG
jgi:hypothetical protein